MLSPSMFESQLSEKESSPMTQAEEEKMLSDMIQLKKENNYLQKEAKLLEFMFMGKKSIEPIANYNKTKLLVDSHSRQNFLNEFIPVNDFEIVYKLENPYMKKGRRRKLNKNKNNEDLIN